MLLQAFRMWTMGQLVAAHVTTALINNLKNVGRPCSRRGTSERWCTLQHITLSVPGKLTQCVCCAAMALLENLCQLGQYCISQLGSNFYFNLPIVNQESRRKHCSSLIMTLQTLEQGYNEASTYPPPPRFKNKFCFTQRKEVAASIFLQNRTPWFN